MIYIVKIYLKKEEEKAGEKCLLAVSLTKSVS